MELNILVAFIVILIVICLILTYRLMSSRVYWFHRPDCKSCQDMEEAWKQFRAGVLISFIRPIKIDVSKMSNFADNFDVGTVPMIVKVVNDKRFVYDGDRSAEDLIKWAKNTY